MCASELTRPLAGKRVLVTRAEAQANEVAELLVKKGAMPVVVPTIVIGPPDEPALAAQALGRIDTFDWVAFTSQNGVDRSIELLARAGKGASALAPVKVAAVGPATAAALTRHGVTVDLIAKESQGEGLAKEMLARSEPPRRLLLLRAQVAREAFPEALRAAGWTVEVTPVYATRPAPGLDAMLTRLFHETGSNKLDAALFSSGSTVTHVCGALGERAPSALATVVVAVIGPVTREAAETHGVRVDVEANPHTFPALVDALEAHLAIRV